MTIIFFQREVSFYINSCDSDVNSPESFQFTVSKPTSYLTNIVAETDSISDTFKPSGSHKLQLTALSVVDGPKNVTDNKSTNMTTSLIPQESASVLIRPCLVCGVSVSASSSTQMKRLESVWASSTALASSSSLVHAMNSVNSAASNSLDIMKVAGDSYSPVRSHYLVLCDFHHKLPASKPTKKDQ